MQPLAFGALGLSHEAFYSITPSEYNELVEGYERRRDQELGDKAWMLAHVLNCFAKKGHRVRPEQLYKRRFK